LLFVTGTESVHSTLQRTVNAKRGSVITVLKYYTIGDLRIVVLNGDIDCEFVRVTSLSDNLMFMVMWVFEGLQPMMNCSVSNIPRIHPEFGMPQIVKNWEGTLSIGIKNCAWFTALPNTLSVYGLEYGEDVVFYHSAGGVDCSAYSDVSEMIYSLFRLINTNECYIFSDYEQYSLDVKDAIAAFLRFNDECDCEQCNVSLHRISCLMDLFNAIRFIRAE
jgi:hypothetical protein